MLIRRFHNHCLILVRHQVKNSFNNLNASQYFPAIGHIVAAYQNHQQERQRLDTLYTHHALNLCLSLHLSKLLPFLFGFTVTRGYDAIDLYQDCFGQSCYVITNTTTNYNPHDSKKSVDEGGSSHVMSLTRLCIEDGVGPSKGEREGPCVKSPVSSSFICSSVYVTTTCKGSRFPMYQ